MDNMTRYKQDLKFPTDEDLSGAATALLRLQDTYKLETASVARGELNGVQYTTQLTGKSFTSVVNSSLPLWSVLPYVPLWPDDN